MPRKRRTKEEWKSTIEAQKASGLSAPQYCAKHDIHLQSFYARKSDMNKSWPKPNAKAWVKVSNAKPVAQNSLPQLSLQYQDLVINILQTPSPRWLSEVIKELAS